MTFAVILLFLSLVALAAIGIPLAWALGLACFCSMLAAGRMDLLPLFAAKFLASGMHYALLAVFFFEMSSAIMQYGGQAGRLADFSTSLVGHMKGGTSLGCVIASSLFAGISGSSVATTAAIGSHLYPELKRQGYPEPYAAALPAVGGVLGVVIPPSVPFILYGAVTHASPAMLLMSGLIPGFLGAAVIFALCVAFAKRRGFPAHGQFSDAGCWRAFRRAVWALVLPPLVLGGIYCGVFPPVGAAAVSCAYGLVVSAVVYRELSYKAFVSLLRENCLTTANIVLLAMSAGMFVELLGVFQVSGAFEALVVRQIGSAPVYVTGVIVLLAILGIYFDASAVILLLAPLLAPAAASLGVNPVMFGLIFIFTTAVGQATPPYGTCLFVSRILSGRSALEIGVAAAPFCLALLAVVALCAALPFLATFLPGTML